MQRTLAPELLDELPAGDPRAARSRLDLRRVNSWMGNARFLASAVNSLQPNKPLASFVELGAGDGSFFFKFAERLRAAQPEPAVLLLDRQNLLTPQSRMQFQRLGWRVETRVSDVFAWLREPTDQAYDVIVANLFLHHFSDEKLKEMFELVRAKAKLFVAVEPRRAALPLFASKLLWAIGCNHVTRHDAVVSVRAGFAGLELSALWGRTEAWVCNERSAGLFSHFFAAQRTD